LYGARGISPCFFAVCSSVVAGHRELAGARHAWRELDIAASEDLLNWLDLGSVLADTNGLMQFDDINAPPTPPVSTRPPRNN